MCRSFLAAALLVCGSSQAADWVSLGKSKSGNDEHELLDDISSIRLSGEVRRACNKVIDVPHCSWKPR
jgi:hypothetical protein